MGSHTDTISNIKWPTLANFTLPAKALVTMVILTMTFAMAGALGQIVVHDIIPTFFADQDSGEQSEKKMNSMTGSNSVDVDDTLSARGDLFSEAPQKEEVAKTQPFYKVEQFVWTLKWTHIHLFGMNMIFIFMGAIALFLDISTRWRFWLIVLPFLGICIDIATMWLKGYFSPAFFWLHIPGGGLFGAIFTYVSIKALWEMWGVRNSNVSETTD